MDSLYIVIPAYNESENIRRTIEEWYPIVEKYHGDGKSRLVIINDGSKDDTYEIMKEMAKTRPLFVPLTKENGGHGSTVLHGYRYAIVKKADFIFQTDSDGQTNPKEFHAFWNLRNQYDAILGKRMERGDGKSRKIVENTVCFLLNLYFGVKVEDANAPFRLMRTSLVNRYIRRMPKHYHLPNIMFTTFFSYYGENIKFMEITFKPRQGGKNTINGKRIAKIGWDALGEFHAFKQQMQKY